MRILLITVVLSLFLAPAAVALVVEGPEKPVSAPTYDVSYGGQYVEAMASDGNDFLIIWNDYASGREGLRASRISSSGELRSVPPVRLSAGLGFTASVVWNGEAYFATWYDDTLKGVAGVRIDRDGRRLESPRLLIAGAQAAHRALAWNGTNFLLAYRIELNRPLGALLDRNGNVIRRDIAMASGSTLPVLSSDGDRFFVFWRVPSHVPGSSTPILETFYVSRVDGNGTLLDPSPGIVAMTGAVGLSWDVAFHGGRFAVVAIETRPAGGGVLRRFIVDAATLASTSLAPIEANTPEVRVVAAGSEFVAWWIAGTQASELSIVSRSFRVDGTEGTTVTALPLGAAATGPVVAWNGQRFGVAWMDRSLSGPSAAPLGDVFAIALDASRTAVFGAQSKTAVSIAAPAQHAPAIATGNGETMVLWIESVGDELRSELRGVRLRFDGSQAGPPFVLSTPSRVPQKAAIAFTGSGYRVVWLESNRVMTRTITAPGVMSEPIELAASGYDVAVASNGSTTLAVWSGATIQGVRFINNARIDVTPLAIAGEQQTASQVAAASNGSDFLVTWTEGAPLCIHLCPPPLVDIYAARVTAAGSVDAAPIPVATATEPEFDPSVASDGRDYIVVYTRVSPATAIVARRVLREGVIGAAAILESDGSTQSAVAYTGWRFAIAWVGKSGEVRTVFLSPSLDLFTAPATIANGSAPAIAAVDAQAALVVYVRAVDDATYGASTRVFARTVAEAIRSRRVR